MEMPKKIRLRRLKTKTGNKISFKKSGFYQSKRWRKVRLLALQRDHYLCQACLAKKIITPATEVHHKKPLEDFPELRLDLDNLQSLCWACHEETKRRHPVGLPSVVRIIRM